MQNMNTFGQTMKEEFALRAQVRQLYLTMTFDAKVILVV